MASLKRKTETWPLGSWSLIQFCTVSVSWGVGKELSEPRMSSSPEQIPESCDIPARPLPLATPVYGRTKPSLLKGTLPTVLHTQDSCVLTWHAPPTPLLPIPPPPPCSGETLTLPSTSAACEICQGHGWLLRALLGLLQTLHPTSAPLDP